MAKKPDFDLQAAHRYFSVKCFNQAWVYIDKPTREAGEDARMLQLSLASLWHWTQREDVTPTNFSIGYWQVSRVFALMKQAENARYYGDLCLHASQEDGVEAFNRGYAYEALARAEMVRGNKEVMGKFLIQARQIADELTNQEEKKMLLRDLATIQKM